MEKVFTYQRHLRYTYHFVLGAIAGAIALSWIVPRVLSWVAVLPVGATTRLSLYLTFTLLALGMLVLRVGRELKDTVFIVTNDRLVLKSPTKFRSMLFEAVERFGYRYGGGIVGYAELRSGDGVIRLPAIIRDLSGLASLVRRLLDEAGKDGAYDRREIDELIRRSRVSDLSEERTYEAMPALSLMALGAAVLGFLTAYRIWDFSLLFAIAWSLLSGVFPAVSFLAGNALISAVIHHRLAHAAPSPESVEPARYYSVIGSGALVAYLVLGIALRAFLRHGVSL